ncbi:aldose epimerase family protein [Amphiplicatus metriothermophilus]|uniref:Aldose 1-epimerase n=1 Tax=Amphiplicatus metriothermophilus TaxID=1519374 RepID=A0A239PYQ0_9PROT|nr:aldose epimerase family protein [Amphiplicatus metriothermophilus]MBB5519807.1 aldose 1-epimerase [Amphiplicatus metriothermophilus]SNT75153.1 aldose 1-epimerase [Amphiplicatus metriothermophilus]
MARKACTIAVVALYGYSSAAIAAEAERAQFGALADGRKVEAAVLANSNGVSARIIALGATLQSLSTPDRDGEIDDITLGYDTAAQYMAKPQYFGATVGRYANRIANGRFEVDGKVYQLETNDGENHLHGGFDGFDRKLWTLESVSSENAEARAVFVYVSADGDGGYPGTLTARAIYTLNDADELTIEYQATTDRRTIVNITNHSFFNLAGQRAARSAMDQRLVLNADAFTPVDEGLIPTGELRAVAGSPFDFRKPAPVGARIRDASNEQILLGRGYDHNYVIKGEAGEMRFAARLEDPVSGRALELWTDAPGVQFYSGNFLDGTIVGKGRRAYRQGDGICLEPQTFPDAPNQKYFPSPYLDPGETYSNKMILRLSVSE